MANINVKPKVDKLLTSDENAGAIGTGLVSHRTALEALGVGTAGFVATGTSVGTVPVLLAPTATGGNAKLPVLDGSNLTGLSEIPELHPTHLILNELGTAVAPNNTLAYNGDFLSRHNGITAGGEVLSNSETVYNLASSFINKTIFRKRVSSEETSDVRPIKLNIKVRGSNRVSNVSAPDLRLGILQVYACYVPTGQAVLDTGFFDVNGPTLNRYDLFGNTRIVNNVFFAVTDNTVMQMNYDIDAVLFNSYSFESTTTKLAYSTIVDILGGGDHIVGSAETRTIHSVYNPASGISPLIPISNSVGVRDLVVQATIFSRDRVHVGPTFSKGSGMIYAGALWYDTTVNELKIFNGTVFAFEQYKISTVVVPTYYSATEAGAATQAYVAGKYIFFGDKDYYKKGESGLYVTKYNYLNDSSDPIVFETSMNFISY